MARVCILGIGPLEFEGPSIYSGSANRVWQLARPLLERGHDLTLVCMRSTAAKEPLSTPAPQYISERLTYYSLDETTQFNDDALLQSIVDDSKPDVLIGANIYPSARVSVLKRSVPLFADLNGYTMGEAQAKARRENEDGYLVHFYNIVCQALSNADAFSVCSGPYREGILGELLVLGREFDPDAVFVIEEAKEPPEKSVEDILEFRSRIAEPDDFLVLWSGGYNTWADVRTLFGALEFAMRQNPRIRYISTGGEIAGHDEKTYPELLRLVDSSESRARFTFLGWVPMNDAQLAFRAADVGINADLDCFETMLGARNRITEMLATGLPPITTRGAEIARIVEREDMGWVTPMGDVQALADSILEAAGNKEEIARKSQRGRAYAASHYTYDAAARPLIKWVEQVT